MKLLVTAKNGFFKIKNNTVTQFKRHDHFGITWNRDWVFAFKRGGPGGTTVERFKHDFTYCGGMSLAANGTEGTVRETHQSVYVPKTKRIVTTNTAYNELIEWVIPDKWEDKGNISNYQRYNYTPFNKDKPKENHINSIFFDGQYYWTVHHNRTIRPPELIQLDESFKVLQRYELKGNDRAHAHNCCRIDDTVIALLSKENCVVQLNWKTGKRKEIQLDIDPGLYSRGLAITKDRVYIGASVKAKKAQERKKFSVYIGEYDYLFNLINLWHYPPIKELLEIRVIHDLDLAHNGIKL